MISLIVVFCNIGHSQSISDFQIGTPTTLDSYGGYSENGATLTIPFRKNTNDPTDTASCWAMWGYGYTGGTPKNDCAYSPDGGVTWSSPFQLFAHTDFHSSITFLGGDSAMAYAMSNGATGPRFRIVHDSTMRTEYGLTGNTTGGMYGHAWMDTLTGRIWALCATSATGDYDTVGWAGYYTTDGGANWTKSLIWDVNIKDVRIGVSGRPMQYPWPIIEVDSAVAEGHQGYHKYVRWNGSSWATTADSIIAPASGERNFNLQMERVFAWYVDTDFNSGADTLMILVAGRGWAGVTDPHILCIWKYYEGGTGSWNCDTVLTTSSSYFTTGNFYELSLSVLNSRYLLNYKDVTAGPDTAIYMRELTFSDVSTMTASDAVQVNPAYHHSLNYPAGVEARGAKKRGWVTYETGDSVVVVGISITATEQYWRTLKR